MTNPRETRLELGFLLSDCARLLRKVVDQRARELGYTRAQWAVLKAISRHEGVRQIDIAEHMDIGAITVARLVDRLEAAELVERRPDPKDRRARRLYLKPGATAALDALRDLGDEILVSVLAGFSEPEIAQSRDALERIRKNLLDLAPHGTPPAFDEDETDQAERPMEDSHA